MIVNKVWSQNGQHKRRVVLMLKFDISFLVPLPQHVELVGQHSLPSFQTNPLVNSEMWLDCSQLCRNKSTMGQKQSVNFSTGSGKVTFLICYVITSIFNLCSRTIYFTSSLDVPQALSTQGIQYVCKFSIPLYMTMNVLNLVKMGNTLKSTTRYYPYKTMCMYSIKHDL